MIDYKKEIDNWIGGMEDWVAVEGMTDATMIASPLVAQVIATQALTEQQRVANLIAYYALVVEQEVHGIVPSQQTRKRCDDASNQIIEGLGL